MYGTTGATKTTATTGTTSDIGVEKNYYCYRSGRIIRQGAGWIASTTTTFLLLVSLLYIVPLAGGGVGRGREAICGSDDS